MDSIKNPTIIVHLPSAEPVSSLLKCMMCKKFPVFPSKSISRCEAGHLYCHACAEVQTKRRQGCIKLNNLSNICRKVIIPCEPLDLVVQYMLDKSVFVCPNNGCEENVAGEKLEEHIKKCGFK